MSKKCKEEEQQTNLTLEEIKEALEKAYENEEPYYLDDDDIPL